MTDRSLILPGPLVRAVLREIAAPGTGKTQHREVLKCQPDPTAPVGHIEHVAGTCTFDLHTRPRFARGRFIGSDRMQIAVSPYAVGDRLWVREAWRIDGAGRSVPWEPCLRHGRTIEYRADGYVPIAWQERSPLFMPRVASRLTLIVTEVRVERLQDISREDVIAEGIGEREGASIREAVAGWHEPFAALWDSLHGPDAWAKNPWVAAVTYRPVLANIDALPAVATEAASQPARKIAG